mgnify:CR=1 FL=1
MLFLNLHTGYVWNVSTSGFEGMLSPSNGVE